MAHRHSCPSLGLVSIQEPILLIRGYLGGLYPALHMGSPPETVSDIAEMHSLASYEVLAGKARLSAPFRSWPGPPRRCLHSQTAGIAPTGLEQHRWQLRPEAKGR